MSRPVNYLIVFVAAIVALPLSALIAQDQTTLNDQFTTNDQNVTRVIKLRSNDPPTPPKPNLTQQRSSRTARVAQRPANLPDPTQLEFDEIAPQATPETQSQTPGQQPQSSSRGPVVDEQFMSEQKRTIPNLVKSKAKDSVHEPMVVTAMAPQIASKVMAPEQIMGESQIASDVWALGVIIYALYTEWLPFFDDNEKALMDLTVQIGIDAPQDIPVYRQEIYDQVVKENVQAADTPKAETTTANAKRLFGVE